MKKLLLLIIISGFFLSCSRHMIGSYEHNICCHGSSCYKLKINRNKTFEYEYYSSHIGSGSIFGRYIKAKRKITLLPTYPLEYSAQKSFTEFSLGNKSDSTIINFYDLLPVITKINDTDYCNNYYRVIEINEFDTVINPYSFFKVRNNYYTADSLGHSRAKLFKGDTLEFVNIVSLQSDFQYIIESDNIKTLNVFHASIPIIPKIYEWIVKEYEVSRNSLHPLSYEPEMALLGEHSYFNRDSCISSKTALKVRDRLFDQISRNIDWEIATKEDGCDDWYTIYFDKSGKIKEVLFEPLGDSGEENEKYNIEGAKCRKLIKRSLKRFKIKEKTFNYKTPLLIRLYYNSETKKLELED